MDYRPALVAVAVTACSSAPPTPPRVQQDHQSVAPTESTALGSGECLQPSDCGNGENCFAPDFSPRGVTPCEDGEFCHSMGGEVCTDGRCVPPCTDTSCAAGYVCGPPINRAYPNERKCEPVPCNAAGGVVCADNFRCNATSGQCERLTCRITADCGAAPRACWQGQCYEHPGRCAPHSYCCPP